ncbi:MAG: type II secretion system F family protein [bacterium]
MSLDMLVAVVFLCTTALVFGLFFSFIVVLSTESNRIGRRCDSLPSPHDNSQYSSQAFALLNRHKDRQQREFFSEFPPLLNIPLLIEQAGLTFDIKKCLLFMTISGFFPGFVIWLASGTLAYAVTVGIASSAIPYLYILLKRKRRISTFETRLPQSLEIISRSLRAGHPFSMGLNMISTEMPPPIGTEFGRVFNEHQMGLPLDDSLRDLAKRVPVLDLRFFVLSILIHRQTGGDLAEVLDNLSTVIRNRLKVLGQVRALTAEGRLSGWVLSLLPVFVFIAIQVLNPDYISVLLDTHTGRTLLCVAIFMQFVGILIIRRIVNIKV